MVRASVSQLEGCRFEPWPGHTKEFSKWYPLPSCLVLDVWNGKVKYVELPVGQHPTVAFTAFTEVWLRAT